MFFRINVLPRPLVPNTDKAIEAVEITSAERVAVFTDQGKVEGAAAEVLPLSLLRSLGNVLKNAGKTLGPSLKKFKTPRDIWEEDVTYDQDSTADPADKPEEQVMHPKVRAIRRTFDRSIPLKDKESLNFPEDLPSEHPKEEAIRKVFEEDSGNRSTFGSFRKADDLNPARAAQRLAKQGKYAQAIKEIRKLKLTSLEGSSLKTAIIHILDEASYEEASPKYVNAVLNNLVKYLSNPAVMRPQEVLRVKGSFLEAQDQVKEAKEQAKILSKKVPPEQYDWELFKDFLVTLHSIGLSGNAKRGEEILKNKDSDRAARWASAVSHRIDLVKGQKAGDVLVQLGSKGDVIFGQFERDAGTSVKVLATSSKMPGFPRQLVPKAPVSKNVGIDAKDLTWANVRKKGGKFVLSYLSKVLKPGVVHPSAQVFMDYRGETIKI